MKKVFLVAIAAVLGLTACEKDDDVKLSNLEILQAHKWRYSAMTRTENGEVKDLFTPDNCEIDDIHEFLSDMTGIYYTGTSKCFPEQEASYTGTYWLSENRDTLHFDDEEFPTLIKSISLEKMEWEVKIITATENAVVNFTLVEDK